MEHKCLRTVAAFAMLLSACGGEKAGKAGTTAAGEARRDVPVPIVLEECDGDGLTVDVNNDQKPDIRHAMDDGKRSCTEIDMNFDGKSDVYRFYENDGAAVRFEQHDLDFDGRIDQQAFYATGAMQRKELDTNFDGLVDTWMWCKGPMVDRAERARRKPGRVDTWETYAEGELTEIQYDENNDGKPEKWEVFKSGALAEIRYDGNGDGVADRNEAAVGQTDQKDKPISCDGTTLPEPTTPTNMPAMPPETTGAGDGSAPAEGTPDPAKAEGATEPAADAPAGATPAIGTTPAAAPAKDSKKAPAGRVKPSADEAAMGAWQEG